jgi:hypothetical protein
MQHFGFRKADGFACEPLDPGAQQKVFVFYSLSMLLANDMLVRRNISGVTRPIIRVKGSNIESLKLGDQLSANVILASPKDKRQNTPRRRVDGIPQPPLILFAADIAPWFIGLNFHRRIKEMTNFHGDFTGTHEGIDRLHFGRLFLAWP